jgi:arginase
MFAAGLVRVPRAWGDGGEAMIESASLPLDWPEASTVDEETLAAQNLALASDLPERPLVLGGCCCSHVGAVEGLATRHDRIGVVWLDAHGDLNTPQSSPSGNEWGMPLRMLIDGGTVRPENVVLVGARNLDPPEEEFIAASGIHTGEDAFERALIDVDCVYVALDADVFDEADVGSFMPEPGGLRLGDVERLFTRLADEATVIGAGFTGLRPDPDNVPKLERLGRALGL